MGEVGGQSLPTLVECRWLLIYAEWESILCLLGYMSVWNLRQTQAKTNWQTWRQCTRRSTKHMEGFQSCRRGDERLRSLTLCTSCWDIGSSHNPVRNRRGQLLLAQILQNFSVFPSHTTAKEILEWDYCLILCIQSVIIPGEAWFIICCTCLPRGCSPVILLNHSEVDKNTPGSASSPCSLCADIFYRCCVNSCGHTVEHVAPANSSSAG